jgi:hypothetical protein
MPIRVPMVNGMNRLDYEAIVKASLGNPRIKTSNRGTCSRAHNRAGLTESRRRESGRRMLVRSIIRIMISGAPDAARWIRSSRAALCPRRS